ncbi:hypothetical protein FOL47_009653 [Perkinsus chesapeaki]|uniref:RING-type domain-containing protein n=1 Tax=Perkinsus chesapeaki TaxID=330153 RepID=A0A7J6MS13_PERCH|nr:hypothetical protein FOL47_009653 [Perkinsus chesapeaki]
MSASTEDDSVNLAMLLAAVGMIVAVIILLLCICWRVHKYIGRERLIERVRCHSCNIEVEVPRDSEEEGGVVRVFLCRSCMFGNAGNEFLLGLGDDVEVGNGESEADTMDECEAEKAPSRLEMAIQKSEGKLFKLRKITTNFFRHAAALILMKTINSLATPKTEISKTSRDRNSYSSSSRKSFPVSTAKTLIPGLCTVCFEETDVRLVFLPCGHSGICLDCMKDILRVLKGECHVCRRDIDTVVKVIKRRRERGSRRGLPANKARTAEALEGGVLSSTGRMISDEEYIGSALSVFDCELASRPLRGSQELGSDTVGAASQWSLRSFPRLEEPNDTPTGGSSSSTAVRQTAGTVLRSDDVPSMPASRGTPVSSLSYSPSLRGSAPVFERHLVGASGVCAAVLSHLEGTGSTPREAV